MKGVNILAATVDAHAARSIGERGTPLAFPQITAIAAEVFLAVLQILLVYDLLQFVDAEVSLFLVTLYADEQPAIRVVDCRPDAKAPEQVETVDLTNVGRIILEPFQVHLPHSSPVVEGILHIFAQVQAVVAVVPVGTRGLVFLSAVALRTAARGVALEPKAGLLHKSPLAILVEQYVTGHITVGVVVRIVCRQQRVPLFQVHLKVNLWQRLQVEDVGQPVTWRQEGKAVDGSQGVGFLTDGQTVVLSAEEHVAQRGVDSYLVVSTIPPDIYLLGAQLHSKGHQQTEKLEFPHNHSAKVAKLSVLTK